MRRFVLVAAVALALAGLFAASFANAKHQPCTHGESSAAVAVWGGHVHVIRTAHATGCTQ